MTQPWVGSSYRTRGTGVAMNAIVVAVTGLQSVSVPLGTVLPVVPSGCTLLAQPDLLTLASPVAGTVDTQLVIPGTPSLAGIVLHQQLVVLEVDASLNFVQNTSSNAIAATIGAF